MGKGFLTTTTTERLIQAWLESQSTVYLLATDLALRHDPRTWMSSTSWESGDLYISLTIDTTLTILLHYSTTILETLYQNNTYIGNKICPPPYCDFPPLVPSPAVLIAFLIVRTWHFSGRGRLPSTAIAFVRCWYIWSRVSMRML